MLVSGQSVIAAGAGVTGITIDHGVTPFSNSVYRIIVASSVTPPNQFLALSPWVTNVSVSAKTVTNFTITTDIPAPAGGGTLDWALIGEAA